MANVRLIMHKSEGRNIQLKGERQTNKAVGVSMAIATAPAITASGGINIKFIGQAIGPIIAIMGNRATTDIREHIMPTNVPTANAMICRNQQHKVIINFKTTLLVSEDN